jgi:hypothetical protein
LPSADAGTAPGAWGRATGAMTTSAAAAADRKKGGRLGNGLEPLEPNEGFDIECRAQQPEKEFGEVRGQVLAEALGRLVGENLAVANVNHAMSVFGYIGLVGDQHDGVAAGVQCIE